MQVACFIDSPLDTKYKIECSIDTLVSQPTTNTSFGSQVNLALCSLTSSPLTTANYSSNLHITVRVQDPSVSYFGVNHFYLKPSYKLVFNNKFVLVPNNQTLPLAFNVNTQTPSTVYEEYLPMLVYGLALPYNFYQYDYTAKTFSSKKIINWVTFSIITL